MSLHSRLAVVLAAASIYGSSPQAIADQPPAVPIMLCVRGLWNDGGLLETYDSRRGVRMVPPVQNLDLNSDAFIGFRTNERALRVGDLNPSAWWLRMRNGDLWRVESLQLEEGRFRLRHAILGSQIRFLDQVAAVFIGTPGVSDDVLTPASKAGQSPDEWDRVRYTDGQVVSGIIEAIDDKRAILESEAGPLDLPLPRVKRIDFFDRTEPTGTDQHRRYPAGPVQLDLVDGSSVSFRVVHCDPYGYSAHWQGDSLPPVQVRIPTDKVRALWQRARFWKWLGEIPLLAVEGRSMAGRIWPVVRDRNVMGDPMIVGGRTFTRGLGMHAASRAAWKIDESFTRLRGAVALDDSARPYGRVDVHIRIDGRQVFTVSDLKVGMTPVSFDVPLRAGAALELISEAGAEGEIQDRVDWLDMFLVNAPSSTTSQAP